MSPADVGATFTVGSDGLGGTDVTDDVPCFGRGTRISTARGEVCIEELRIGDAVLLASPNGPVSRQVAWLGRRRVDCARHPNPEALWPVLIRGGAFGADMPARDLYVSPRHSVFTEGVLISAEKLVNGATLIQVQCNHVEYWHTESDAQDILLAEGLPTESYLDNGNRSAFEGGGEFLDLHPDFAPKHWTDTCVPLVFGGAVWQRTKTLLLARAQMLGHQITAEDDLHVIADGKRVNPIHRGTPGYCRP